MNGIFTCEKVKNIHISFCSYVLTDYNPTLCSFYYTFISMTDITYWMTGQLRKALVFQSHHLSFHDHCCFVSLVRWDVKQELHQYQSFSVSQRMTKWLQTKDESNRIIRKLFVWWIAQITQSLFTDLAVFMRMLLWSADAGDLVMPLYCVHLLITLTNLPTLSSDQDENNLHNSFANNASSYCHNNYSNS